MYQLICVVFMQWSVMTSYNRENLKLNNLKTSNTSTDQNCDFVIQTKSIILPDSSMISW